jgi:hypothetical protein
MFFDQEDLDRMLDVYGFKVDIREEDSKIVYALYQDVGLFDSMDELYHWLIVEFDSK